VSPPEGNLRRARINFDNLPGEGRHHLLEDPVASVEVDVGGAIVLVGGYDGVVGADLKHVLARLGRAAVDCEAVVGGVDCSPVG